MEIGEEAMVYIVLMPKAVKESSVTRTPACEENPG